MSSDAAGGQYVRAWDLPTRIVHWSFAAAVPVLWWTGSRGEWQVHIVVGEALLGVLVFRIAWGFLGGSTARFSQFIRGPRQILRYAQTLTSRREMWTAAGHNPLGSWSAAALLTLLAIDTASGLFAQSLDGLAEGPLSHWLSDDRVGAATNLHGMAFDLLVALLALHLAAVAFYTAYKRQNLVPAMVHGKRLLPPGSAALRPAPAWRLVLAILVAIGCVAIAVV